MGKIGRVVVGITVRGRLFCEETLYLLELDIGFYDQLGHALFLDIAVDINE